MALSYNRTTKNALLKAKSHLPLEVSETLKENEKGKRKYGLMVYEQKAYGAVLFSKENRFERNSTKNRLHVMCI